jgi:hypothetical protein
MHGALPSKSSRLPVPISKLQSDILRLIAAKRDPERFVAGSVPINRSGPRYSADIFHDRQDRVAEAALADAGILADAGYAIVWPRQQPATYGATVRLGNEETKLEWVVDSDYRFFPVVKDDQFGYVLHVVDLCRQQGDGSGLPARAARHRRSPHAS